MGKINLVGHLVAGQFYLFGIDDDHVVAAIDVRGVIGFGFAFQQHRHFCGQSTEHLSFGVDQDPFLGHRGRVGADGFVT